MVHEVNQITFAILKCILQVINISPFTLVLIRSLSSSEIELLKDEFLLGPQEPRTTFNYHEAKPEVKRECTAKTTK